MVMAADEMRDIKVLLSSETGKAQYAYTVVGFSQKLPALSLRRAIQNLNTASRRLSLRDDKVALVASRMAQANAAIHLANVITSRFPILTDVVVEGDVSIDLDLGLENYNWDEAIRQADYLRGSGTDQLVFGYTVQLGDMDDRGIGLILGKEGAGFGGSGTIKAEGTDVERNPWYLGTGHQPDHKVDTVPPSVESIAITSQPADGSGYMAGESITAEVSFSEEVTFRGSVLLEFDIGGAPSYAPPVSASQGSYGKSLVFQYRVEEGDTDGDGIVIEANKLSAIGGVFDSAGNAADLSHPAVSPELNQKVQGSN